MGASGWASTVGLLGILAGTVEIVGKDVVTDCPSLTMLPTIGPVDRRGGFDIHVVRGEYGALEVGTDELHAVAGSDLRVLRKRAVAVAHDARGSSQSFPLLPTLTRASPNCRGLTPAWAGVRPPP